MERFSIFFKVSYAVLAQSTYSRKHDGWVV